MKKVLFIGVTRYNLERDAYLGKKFEGLSRGIVPYVLAKGKPFRKKIWNTEFYLLPPSVFFWPMAFWLAFWLCLVKKIDVIVAQSPLVEGFVGSILKRILRKELIVEVHGDWEKAFLVKKRRFGFLQKKMIPILARASLKSADKIRAISTFTLEKIQGICPSKSYFVFPTFTDIDDFLKEENAELGNTILFVGNLQKVKGIDFLIEAFSQIASDFPEFKLVLIGEGPERENLQSLVAKFQLENKVEFKGRLSLEETRGVMKNCYCLVLPSLSEGLGRVLAEAQALRKPVIGSNVGGVPDLIENGKNGFLFEVGNIGQLAEKLRVLLNDRNLAMEMGERGREFVQSKFSNEDYIANYLEMING